MFNERKNPWGILEYVAGILFSKIDRVVLIFFFPKIWDLKKLWILLLRNALDDRHYQNQAYLA